MKKMKIILLLLFGLLFFKIDVFSMEIKDSNYGQISIDEDSYTAIFNFEDAYSRKFTNLFLVNELDVDKGNDSKTVYRMYMNIKEICDITNNIYTNCNYDSDSNSITIRLHEFNPNNYIEYRITFYTDKIFAQIVQVVEGTTYTIANNERASSSNESENNNEKEATLLIIDGEKYVPVRLFSEVLFYDVTYDNSNRTATIDTYNILNKDNVTCSMVNKTDSYYLYNSCENGKIYIIPANIKVYVSPSDQVDNAIIGGLGYSNESEIMNKIADYLVPALESRGIVTFRNEPTMDLDQIVADSQSHNVDFHFAIHSNASGGRGPEIWVHPNGTQVAYDLADRIYSSLLTIYPQPSLGRGIKNNMSLRETNPANVNNGVLVEVAFHDNIDDATWIVNNFELIGNTMANAIADYYLEYK